MCLGTLSIAVRCNCLLGGSTMISIRRSSFICQFSLACRRANFLYSPAIHALEHHRIAIQQHVERDNPHGLRDLPNSQKKQRDEEGQYERGAVA